MKKGLFWVAGERGERLMLIHAVECDKNGRRLCATPAYNSRKGDSFSHQQSWADAAREQPGKVRNKPWDYFPRGRVEIRNGRAIVHFNPCLSEWDGFNAAVVSLFGLEDFPTVMAPDYSVHYQCMQEQSP
jgi:hypothetical protein